VPTYPATYLQSEVKICLLRTLGNGHTEEVGAIWVTGRLAQLIFYRLELLFEEIEEIRKNFEL
jgi:hypothetical protein